MPLGLQFLSLPSSGHTSFSMPHTSKFIPALDLACIDPHFQNAVCQALWSCLFLAIQILFQLWTFPQWFLHYPFLKDPSIVPNHACPPPLHRVLDSTESLGSDQFSLDTHSREWYYSWLTVGGKDLFPLWTCQMQVPVRPMAISYREQIFNLVKGET